MKAAWLLATVAAVATPLASELTDELRVLADDVRALEREAALERADALLAGDMLPTERLRADVHFARGLVLALDPARLKDGSVDPDGPRAARGDLRAAQALAGPGALRMDATYDLGWVELQAAEAWYERIPEVRAQGGAPPAVPPGGPPARAGEDTPDPLAEARTRYEAAREDFVQRLRQDWRDEDTRANLEWIQRRLAELRRIEEERQEQEDPEQDSEDPQQDQSSEDGEEEQQEGEDGAQEDQAESEGDEGEGDPPGEDPGEQEGEPQDEPQESDAEEQPPGEEPEPGEGEEDRAGAQEQPPTPEGEPQPSGGEGEAAPAERVLTREEVMRLLDRLQELEEEGERVRALLQQSRRVPVERDW